VFSKYKVGKVLDYIAVWFYQGAKYIENTKSSYAFVSTNSICQGEQVGILWPLILNHNVEISFAVTSFKWTNNAKGQAGVTTRHYTSYICLIYWILYFKTNQWNADKC